MRGMQGERTRGSSMEPKTKTVTMTIKAVLLRIPHTCEEGMPDNEVYEAARGAWTMNKDRLQEVEYALAVFSGKVVGVYRIKQPWNKSVRDNRDNKSHDKWAFERQDTTEDAIQREFKELDIKDIDDPKQGKQNPVRYVRLECSIDMIVTNK